MVFGHSSTSSGIAINDNVFAMDGCDQPRNDRGGIALMCPDGHKPNGTIQADQPWPRLRHPLTPSPLRSHPGSAPPTPHPLPTHSSPTAQVSVADLVSRTATEHIIAIDEPTMSAAEDRRAVEQVRVSVQSKRSE